MSSTQNGSVYYTFSTYFLLHTFTGIRLLINCDFFYEVRVAVWAERKFALLKQNPFDLNHLVQIFMKTRSVSLKLCFLKLVKSVNAWWKISITKCSYSFMRRAGKYPINTFRNYGSFFLAYSICSCVKWNALFEAPVKTLDLIYAVKYGTSWIGTDLRAPLLLINNC